MSGVAQISGVIRVAARARWGEHVRCEIASGNGQYLGPVFVMQDFLIQRVRPDRAVVHSCVGMDFSSSESLSRRRAANRLNDALLCIYYIGARRMAYLRVGAKLERHSHSLSSVELVVGRRPLSRPVRTARVTLAVATAIAGSLALAACASKYALVTPDGSERVAVNTPESLAKYQDVVARQDAMALERSVLEQKVNALNEQVAALKAYLLEQQRKGVAVGTAPASPGSSDSPPTAPAAIPGPTGNTSTAVGEDRVVFRVNLPIGQTAFSPTEAQKADILRAARTSRSVVIRGRTDAATVDPLETRIALGRALQAREYLLANGVEPGKIRTWYRAAGDFIADNATAEGRAQNRRVEIEVRGIDTAAVNLGASQSVRSNP